MKKQRIRRIRLVIPTALLLAAGWAKAGDVTLSNGWNFFNPEGSALLTNQSATGFNFICNPIVGAIVQSNAAYVTTIALDTTTPSTGVLVTAPGHGIAVGTTATVYLNQTSVAAYNTRASATAHTATAVTANTLAIPTLTYTVDATGGTVGTTTATLAATSGALRPRVYQAFTPVNMSAIGAAFSVQFDFSLLFPSQAANNDVFRVFIGDTVKNAEIIGMYDLGVNTRDDGIKIREDNIAFNTPPYTTSNPYEGAMGTGGQSWAVEGHFPQPGGEAANRLAVTGRNYRMQINLVRVSATELSVLYRYEVLDGANAGDASELYVLRYDETTGLTADTGNLPGTGTQSDAWGEPTGATAPAGALSQINFFGMHFEVGNPFLANGGIIVTNVRVGTENYFKPYTKIIGLTRDANTGNVSLSWNSFRDGTSSGSRYNVTAVDDLADFPATSPFASGIPANASGTTTNIDFGTISPAHYYRVSLDPRPPMD
jgi:hypothetical protein